MQIPSLFSAVPAMVNSGLKLFGVDASAEVGTSTASADAEKESSAALQDVDLTSISPDDFSELIDRLHASGQLSQEGYDELLGVRLELDRARAPHDQPLDLIGLLKSKLSALETPGQGQSDDASALTRRQLDWLESIASQKGINALA
jgi:hypothetical protein